jgi:flagellar biogenesis protein FliO
VYPCLADTTDIPGRDEHAGKLINRDGPSDSAQPAASPQSSLNLDSGRVALALIGVICLILLLRWGARQVFPGAIATGRGQAIRVLARCALAPRQQVVLIQVGRRIVVAADCNSQLISLSQITDADEVASLIGEIRRDKASPIGTPFTSWFRRAESAFAGDEAEIVAADKAEIERSESIESESAAPNTLNTDQPGGDLADEPDRPEIHGLSQRVRDLTRQLGGSNRVA